MIKLAARRRGKTFRRASRPPTSTRNSKMGDEVSFSAPAGSLYLRKDTGRPIVIVAGGTGAAPFISLLEYWFENGFEKNNEIYFFFGVRSRRDLFLARAFPGMGADENEVPLHSRPVQSGARGQVAGRNRFHPVDR